MSYFKRHQVGSAKIELLKNGKWKIYRAEGCWPFESKHRKHRKAKFLGKYANINAKIEWNYLLQIECDVHLAVAHPP